MSFILAHIGRLVKHVRTRIPPKIVAMMLAVGFLAAMPSGSALDADDTMGGSQGYTYYIVAERALVDWVDGFCFVYCVGVRGELWNETNGVPGLQRSVWNPDDYMAGREESFGSGCYGGPPFCYSPPYDGLVIPIHTPVPLPLCSLNVPWC